MAPVAESDPEESKNFAQLASLKYELRQTFDPFGFLQSSNPKSKGHAVFQKPISQWRVCDTDAQGIDKPIARVQRVLIQTPRGVREEMRIARGMEPSSIYVNGEEVLEDEQCTMPPDALVRIDDTEYIYHDMEHVEDAPLHEGRYALHRVIGGVGDMKVRIAQYVATDRAVAVKSMVLNSETRRKIAEGIRRWERLIHPHVLRLDDWYRIGGTMIVSPLARYGNLRDYIEQEGKLSELLARPVVAQAIEGLQYMHSQDILHGDMRADNILVFGKGNDGVLSIKLSDFGLSTPMDQTLGCGAAVTRSANWAPPEVTKGLYNDCSDAYGVGGIMFFVLLELMPHLVKAGKHTFKTQMATRRSQIERMKEAKLSPEGVALLGGLLQTNELVRWDLLWARKWSWFDGCVLPSDRSQPTPFTSDLVDDMASRYQAKIQRSGPPRIAEEYPDSANPNDTERSEVKEAQGSTSRPVESRPTQPSRRRKARAVCPSLGSAAGTVSPDTRSLRVQRECGTEPGAENEATESGHGLKRKKADVGSEGSKKRRTE
ncbi:kinase-like protein [Punctularia strigosozonata HHB-11173 SS5]|uniref:Kinase-like protein n=1 Tax=Punctularia strigosozonata (strain HHB-11173) TaxID=741275 RepID=R7S1R9_PUNST|nr:kinase-like protein [Punctularia strigosozonata HHB-11173 SS5]EIN04168.1 kinase-like protein [Punctularia strigosozonata HHB-11173 SS5]